MSTKMALFISIICLFFSQVAFGNVTVKCEFKKNGEAMNILTSPYRSTIELDRGTSYKESTLEKDLLAWITISEMNLILDIRNPDRVSGDLGIVSRLETSLDNVNQAKLMFNFKGSLYSAICQTR